MTIRKAGSEDHKTIMNFARAIVMQHMEFNPDRFEIDERYFGRLSDMFHKEISNPAARILVAELEGEIVGYAYLKKDLPRLTDLVSDWVWLYDLYLDEKARGKGLGKALLDAGMQEARSMGVSRVMLQTAEENEYARKLFIKYGFKPVARDLMLKLDSRYN